MFALNSVFVIRFEFGINNKFNVIYQRGNKYNK